jgi:DNA-binding response OmpR family regulator
MAQRVLIVEDEQHLAEGLRFNLVAEGYEADVVDTGEGALARLQDPSLPVDLVVLDVMLPGKDGFSVVSELRAARNFVPVLVLTARGRPEDVLKGFAAGADDYLPKPTELAILLARIGGLLRRSSWSRPRPADEPRTEHYSFNGRTIDFDRLELTVGDRVLQLTLMEANLLKARSCPVKRCWNRSGGFARTPTRARSTISWSGCAGTSSRSPPGPNISGRCAE